MTTLFGSELKLFWQQLSEISLYLQHNSVGLFFCIPVAGKSDYLINRIPDQQNVKVFLPAYEVLVRKNRNMLFYISLK